ncbi:MAG: hypothetical protein IKA50_05535 [Clostridia bacterium]|nr:hypothetical protein [Clostridia bacterium]
MLSAILALALVVGFCPVTRVSAQNITGLMYASTVIADRGVVLMGDTHLYMDIDLSVPYIEGDYNLTIDGGGKLTIDGSGNGIAVKSLYCESDLFVQPGWHAIDVTETVYIDNAESFIVGGIYAAGDINIQSSNATIGGNGNAISSTGGNITLGGSTFDIGANGIAVAADTGGIYMTGAFTVNSNNDRTISAARGEVVIEGSLKSTSGAQFDPDVSFVGRDNISIGAREGFFFYGTTLEVEGLGGIGAGNYNGDADISITADSVSIITERYYALNGGNIYVDSDNLWIENRGIEENENVSYTFHTIFADGDATLYSENGGIVGENCLFADGNLTLNGNFVVGADHDSGYAMRSVGRTEVNGNLRVITEDIWCVYAEDGFSFNGSTLELEGYHGIMIRNGDVNIVSDSTELVVSDDCAITDMTGNDSVCNVYIDSDHLWLQGGKHEVHNSGCVDVKGNVTIYSDEATIMGNYGIDASGDIVLDGNFVVKGLLQEAIRSESRVEARRGKLSLATEGDYGCLTAQEFMFNGTTLTADGYSGIWGRLTEIHADSVVITTEVGAALDGDEVYVTANYLWAENKATKAGDGTRYGITANSKLALTVKGGTVIGYDDALHVYDENEQFEFHYIYVNGHLTAVSQTGVGMYAPQGTVELYGGPIVSVGESHGIHAKDVIFEGGSLRVEGDTGIYAIRSVKLTGDDIKITAFNERRSGIWVENGHVDLKGKVVIKTNGWYGINADTHISFEEGYYQIIGPKNDAQAVKARGFLYLDGTLEIIQPDGGHVNGNEIYGAGDSPALEVEIYSAIRDVSLLIDGPRDGQLPDRNASDVYFLDPRCTVESIVWYEDGEEMVSQDALFRAGHRYTVKITISADDPYRFVSGVMGKVNGKSVTTGILDSDNKGMILTANLGECAYAISAVDLEITAPVEGKSPSTSVTDYGAAYGVYSRDVRWGVSTDGINFTMMAAGEKFVGGKYYRVFMDVNLLDGLNGNGYKFAITTAGDTIQPDVVATVNGSPAVVEKAYDQDPEEVITVYFDFGKCNDYIIEEIAITGVTAPVVGQHPSYDVNMFGTGYHIDTTKNSYEDIYWKNPPEKWYYVKNGVQWWDTTTGSWEYVYENDTFLPGHTYVCQLYLATDDGYNLASVWDLQATVNGNPAEIVEGWTDTWNTRVTYAFPCEENVVDRIVVDGITAPQKGQAPDYSPILGNTALYTVDTDYGLNGSGIYWYDCEGRQLEAGEVFGDAGPYRMAIKFVPVYEDYAPLCTFSNDVDVLISGKCVTPYGDWDDVVVGSGFAQAFYTFRNGTSAPEGEQTYTLSGNISVSGATVTLLRGGDVVSTLTAGTTYSIENLSVGVYTLQVSKNGYETAEYSIVIATDVVQDVTLVASAPAAIPGDVNGDGKVNNRDLGRLQQFVNGWDVVIDEDASDVTGDGKVNNRDLGLLQQFVNGWDVELK